MDAPSSTNSGSDNGTGIDATENDTLSWDPRVDNGMKHHNGFKQCSHFVRSGIQSCGRMDLVHYTLVYVSFVVACSCQQFLICVDEKSVDSIDLCLYAWVFSQTPSIGMPCHGLHMIRMPDRRTIGSLGNSKTFPGRCLRRRNILVSVEDHTMSISNRYKQYAADVQQQLDGDELGGKQVRMGCCCDQMNTW